MIVDHGISNDDDDLAGNEEETAVAVTSSTYYYTLYIIIYICCWAPFCPEPTNLSEAFAEFIVVQTVQQ